MYVYYQKQVLGILFVFIFGFFNSSQVLTFSILEADGNLKEDKIMGTRMQCQLLGFALFAEAAYILLYEDNARKSICKISHHRQEQTNMQPTASVILKQFNCWKIHLTLIFPVISLSLVLYYYWLASMCTSIFPSLQAYVSPLKVFNWSEESGIHTIWQNAISNSSIRFHTCQIGFILLYVRFYYIKDIKLRLIDWRSGLKSG